MKSIACLILAVLTLALFSGCDWDSARPAAPTTIVVPPTAPLSNAAIETIIATQAQAQWAAQVDAANIKADAAEVKADAAAQRAAKTDADREAAHTAMENALERERVAIAKQTQDQATAQASTGELDVQRGVDIQNRADRYYGIGSLALLAVVFFLWEKNTKMATLSGVMGGACFAIPSVVKGIQQHETFLQWAMVLALGCFLIWHFRAKLEAEAAIAEAKLKALALKAEGEGKVLVTALEHAVSHLASESLVQHAEAAVATVLWHAWSKVKADAELLAVKLRLIKAAAAPAPEATPTTPKA